LASRSGRPPGTKAPVKPRRQARGPASDRAASDEHRSRAEVQTEPRGDISRRISDNGGGDSDAIAERAARLGITPERVLQEYARIAFADLRRLLEWGPAGVNVKAPESLSEADAAAISEIVAGAGAGKYRVKLYDKKAALDAIARHLGMFLPARAQRTGSSFDSAEDARDVLARRLARLAGAGAEG